MTPEEKSLLERTYKLAEENNSILRSMRRSNRVGMVMRILYWVVIIGVSVGLFYAIQPYVNNVLKMYGQAQAQIENIQSGIDEAKSYLPK